MSKPKLGFAGPPSNKQELGARLKSAREYVGVNQEEAAKHLGVPRSAISEMETGKRAVGVIELTKLARLYQRAVGWFTDEVVEDVPADVAHLARTASELSDTDRQELRRFAEFLRSKSKASADDAT
ncbi:MAG TPA: XRE family transcriptional regulator [Hyphomonadaceae bacterium]|nr:XRE family transcriptional regulator [Hyphomonadaceae bacterium]